MLREEERGPLVERTEVGKKRYDFSRMLSGYGTCWRAEEGRMFGRRRAHGRRAPRAVDDGDRGPARASGLAAGTKGEPVDCSVTGNDAALAAYQR